MTPWLSFIRAQLCYATPLLQQSASKVLKSSSYSKLIQKLLQQGEYPPPALNFTFEALRGVSGVEMKSAEGKILIHEMNLSKTALFIQSPAHTSLVQCSQKESFRPKHAK